MKASRQGDSGKYSLCVETTLAIQSVKRAFDILSLFTPSQPTHNEETRQYSFSLRIYELAT